MIQKLIILGTYLPMGKSSSKEGGRGNEAKGANFHPPSIHYVHRSTYIHTFFSRFSTVARDTSACMQ